MKQSIVEIARRSLPLMKGAARREAEALIESFERTANSEGESIADFTRRAASAFEDDMQPVCNAIVAALQAGDEAALKGLRALLPHLLEQVNAQPALADLLAHQLGKSLLDGFNAEAAETQRGEA